MSDTPREPRRERPTALWAFSEVVIVLASVGLVAMSAATFSAVLRG